MTCQWQAPGDRVVVSGTVSTFFLGTAMAVVLSSVSGRGAVHKDQVPDLPYYLNDTTWASHEFLHNPTAHDPPLASTMTCPAVKLQDVARIGAPESDDGKGVGISLVAACRWCAACTLSSQYCRVPLLQLPWRSMHRITSDGSLDCPFLFLVEMF